MDLKESAIESFLWSVAKKYQMKYKVGDYQPIFLLQTDLCSEGDWRSDWEKGIAATNKHVAVAIQFDG